MSNEKALHLTVYRDGIPAHFVGFDQSTLDRMHREYEDAVWAADGMTPLRSLLDAEIIRLESRREAKAIRRQIAEEFRQNERAELLSEDDGWGPDAA